MPPLSLALPSAVAMLWSEPGQPHVAVSVPQVSLAHGDALVEIEFATICGSDVHTTQGHRGAPTPLVLGHEQVGRVIAVGDGAIAADGRPLEVGTRVVWSVTVSCGTCSLCLRGLPQKCTTVAKYGHERFTPEWQLSGGFATHAQLRSGTTIVPVSERLSAAALAPVSCGTATAVAALDAAAAILDLQDARVVIFGAGLIGLTACAMATDRGARVMVVDPDPRRRELALGFGAEHTADPGSTGSVETQLARMGAGPVVAVEASGATRAVASAIDAVDVGGVAVLVGSVFPADSVPFDAESIVRRLATVRGVHNYAPRHLVEAARYVETSSYPFEQLVGATVTLAELDEGIVLAASSQWVRVGIAG